MRLRWYRIRFWGTLSRLLQFIATMTDRRFTSLLDDFIETPGSRVFIKELSSRRKLSL